MHECAYFSFPGGGILVIILQPLFILIFIIIIYFYLSGMQRVQPFLEGRN